MSINGYQLKVVKCKIICTEAGYQKIPCFFVLYYKQFTALRFKLYLLFCPAF